LASHQKSATAAMHSGAAAFELQLHAALNTTTPGTYPWPHLCHSVRDKVKHVGAGPGMT
jgi:hypothetical protein